jgi:hypothetical protein
MLPRTDPIAGITNPGVFSLQGADPLAFAEVTLWSKFLQSFWPVRLAFLAVQ